MLPRIMLVMLVGLLLCGFSSQSDQYKQQLLTLPQHYSQFDVKIGWAVTTENGGSVINGVIQNVRYASMEDVEIRVSVLDSTGKTIARSVDYLLPRRLNLDDLTVFRIGLPVVAAPGTRLEFTYHYVGFDGGGTDDGGVAWYQSFQSVVPAGT